MKHFVRTILILVAFSFGCRNKEEQPKFECSYKRFYSYSAVDKSKNGNQLSADIKAVLDINLPKLKLIKGKLDARIIDTLYSGLRSKITEKKVNYSTAFIEKHNAIIDIICDIEKEINNPLTDPKRRISLQEEKSQKRDAYFNFLLDLNQHTIEDTKPIKEKVKIVDKPSKRELKSLGEFSFQLSSTTGGFKKLFVNGKSVEPLATSTLFNPRIQLFTTSTEVRNVLLLITQNGDTCEYLLPPKPSMRIPLDCE